LQTSAYLKRTYLVEKTKKHFYKSWKKTFEKRHDHRHVGIKKMDSAAVILRTGLF
jgi:hypothetical protein